MRHALELEAEAFNGPSELDEIIEEAREDYSEWETEENDFEEEIRRGRRILMPRAPARPGVRANRMSASVRRFPQRLPRSTVNRVKRRRLPTLAVHEPSSCNCPAACPTHGTEYVRWAQSTLNDMLGLRLPVNGVMGSETRSAVRSFQERAKLPVTGIFGPDTERALLDSSGRRSTGAGAAKPAEPDSTSLPEPAPAQSGPDMTEPAEPATASPAAEFEFEWKPSDDKFEEVGLDEWEMVEGDELYPAEFEVATSQAVTPAAKPPVNLSASPCPLRSPGRTTVRCKTPQLCPPIPNLLCVTAVDNIPFEYVAGKGMIRRNSTTGLYQVVSRIKNRQQKFIPSVGKALSIFIAMMKKVGMPVEAIFTAGSLYCRCVRNTNTLSNHSFGDAIDVVGVRWRSPNGPRETIVHNYENPAERAILRRINACLRLSFSTVIDYHRSDHRDHFHCDMNRGRGRVLTGGSTVAFVQEALNLIGGHHMRGGKLDGATKQALSAFSGRSVREFTSGATYSSVIDDLFFRVASG